MNTPIKPSIYHIIHYDRLDSIIKSRYLYSDAIAQEQNFPGTELGLSDVKKRRRNNKLNTYPHICVGDCVPFYFCPRSIMLYLHYKSNYPTLNHKYGQDSIIHLQFDLKSTVEWAQKNKLKWIFTLSNAGSNYFEEKNNLSDLDCLNWDAIESCNWQNPDIKHSKQAEFLIEEKIPFKLIKCIGVLSYKIEIQVKNIFKSFDLDESIIKVMPDWYY